MRILIVEDDKKIASFIYKGLKAEGYQSQVANDGAEGLQIAIDHEFDLIILDLMLPGLDGVSFVEKYRERKGELPIIILTARDELEMKRKAFNAGADDYLTKPFKYEELLLRVRALIKRGRKNQETHIFKIEDLELNLHSHTVKRGDKKIELSSREFSLLEYLMSNEGRVLSRALIFDNVWGFGFDTDTNLVDVYIMYLRKKIDYDFEPKLIHTVRGMGYVLKVRS